MSFLRSDLPLNQDASGRFLPWIIGFMVYFAALALAATMALDEALSRWQAGLTGTLTVQITPAPAEDLAVRVDQVVGLLKGTPAVAGIELLNDDDVAHLLEPWLGPSEALAGLPLPALIAVNLRPGATVDLAALQQRLAEAAPGTTVDDHGRWLSDLVTLARSVKLLGAIILSLVGAAAVITVIFVTRTGLSIHRRVIELVHLIGARDAYIARQFETHALRLGLAGGLLGVALAALTLLALGQIVGGIESPLLPPLSLRPWQWLVLGLLPVAAAAIAMLTARLTVLRSLNRVM
ncbi:FtsX-like permease family protein [Rhodospirillaceae bacterium SYSU D60014]|uniref:cell division protein FtsX n=1 Tax=Virgifigura deserti TaxID=2268457 RepID=UPI000E665700